MDKITSFNLTEADDTLLALDADGVTPQENLSKLQDSVKNQGDVKLKEKIEKIRELPGKDIIQEPIPKLPIAPNQDVKQVIKSSPALQSIYSKNIATIKKCPTAKNYPEDKDKAAMFLELLGGIYYTARDVNGTIRQLNPSEDLQSQIETLNLVYGIAHINPKVENALDSAKLDRLVSNRKSSEIRSFYTNSNNKTFLDYLLSRNSSRILKTGNLDMLRMLLDIIGNKRVRNNSVYGTSTFLSNYRYLGNRKKRDEYDFLFETLDILDNKWLTKRTSSKGSIYSGNSIRNLSKDATDILGINKNSQLPKIIDLVFKTKSSNHWNGTRRNVYV